MFKNIGSIFCELLNWLIESEILLKQTELAYTFFIPKHCQLRREQDSRNKLKHFVHHTEDV